jgi:AraC family transcriptional regulator
VYVTVCLRADRECDVLQIIVAIAAQSCRKICGDIRVNDPIGLALLDREGHRFQRVVLTALWTNTVPDADNGALVCCLPYSLKRRHTETIRYTTQYPTQLRPLKAVSGAFSVSRWRALIGRGMLPGPPPQPPADGFRPSAPAGGFAPAAPRAKLSGGQRGSSGADMINLRPAQFYGAPQFGAAGGNFDTRALAASGSEHDVERHTHDDAHFILVLSGLYISTALGAADLVRAPALIFNPPGATHRDRFVKGVGTFVGVSLRSATFRDLRDILPLATHAVQLRCRDGLATAFRIAREVRDSRDTVVMESMAWELLATEATPHYRTSDPPSWVLGAYEAIMDRASEVRLDVGDVAAQIGVHPVHLARVFRTTLGCSPGELLRWRRVDRAADMLRHSDISGAQIAAQVGFSDQSHMTRAFRATYGIAPGVYRRRYVSRIQASDTDV